MKKNPFKHHHGKNHTEKGFHLMAKKFLFRMHIDVRDLFCLFLMGFSHNLVSFTIIIFHTEKCDTLSYPLSVAQLCSTAIIMGISTMRECQKHHFSFPHDFSISMILPLRWIDRKYKMDCLPPREKSHQEFSPFLNQVFLSFNFDVVEGEKVNKINYFFSVSKFSSRMSDSSFRNCPQLQIKIS